jgi:DNA-binding transcriptional regulator GbsR (MarR family)
MEPARENPDLRSGLNPVEAEFVRFFVHLATFLNLPRSVGELFGYLFAAESPRPFDEIVSALGISKGSASQGLKWLAQIGAITTVYVPRDRRTFYEPETSMRKLFGSAVQESLRPRLEGNGRLVEAIEERIAAHSSGDEAEHYRTRLSSLRNWNEKALVLLPLLDKLFSLPAPFFPLSFLRSGSDGTDPETKKP